MKTVYLLITIILFISFTSNAQKPFVEIITDSVANKKYMVVQIESEFPGGVSGWIKYLQAHLDVDLGNNTIIIPKGQKNARVSVMVSFTVDKEGNISEVTVDNEKDVPEKLAKEAIRVVKDGTKWIPAGQSVVLDIPGLTEQERVEATIKKGLPKVTSRKRQAITWQVEKE
jgi:hypothetical protein